MPKATVTEKRLPQKILRFTICFLMVLIFVFGVITYDGQNKIVVGAADSPQFAGLPSNNLYSAKAFITPQQFLARVSVILTNKNSQTEQGQVTAKIVEVCREVEPPVERREDASVPPDIGKVLSEGASGVAVDSVYIRYLNGEEVARQVISTGYKSQPQTRIVAHHNLDDADDDVELAYTDIMNFKAYAYTTGGSVGTKTASGKRAAVGLVAVDPSVIPFGTKMYVEGYGFCEAADKGGSIKGKIIDLYMPTKHDCLSWGVRNVKVYFLN
ncbi:MAG: 3D domain-containing protein [Clostridia bacterium]|nr:3D domain-containing protein [Clostridia bacterium]MDD4798721.1 3D domain-containing protein [Clostridia bacterium]